MGSTKVTLRKREYPSGKVSLYLDFYPAIKNPRTGEESRREYLGIYIMKSPRTARFWQQHTPKSTTNPYYKQSSPKSKPNFYCQKASAATRRKLWMKNRNAFDDHFIDYCLYGRYFHSPATL